MNKVTIIPENGLVMVDGRVIEGLDMSSIDPSIHAVQWYGNYGEVEYKSHHVLEDNGSASLVKPANEIITDISPFQSAIDAWEVAKEAEDNPPPPPAPTPEQAIATAEAKRDALLAETDWYAIRAAEPEGTPIPENVLTYRRALRELDNDPAWPDVEWPVLDVEG